MVNQITRSYQIAWNAVKKHIKDRKIIMWGEDKALCQYLRNEHNAEVAGFITTIEKKAGEKRIYVNSIEGTSNENYILIPKITPSAAIRKKLKALGFNEFKDYIFVNRTNTLIKPNSPDYADAYGNRVHSGGCRVSLGKFTENCDIFVDSGFSGNFLIRVFGSGNVKVRIGKKCKSSGSSRLFIFDNGEFNMGDYVSIGDNTKFSVSKNNRITIGDDCMFSYDILVFSGDGHAIFDMETGKRTNLYEIGDPKASITLGMHVWVGAGAYILNRSNIGDSCIVGANSTVKGDFPEYSVAAGNPARVVKSNVTWSRNPYAEDIFECFSYGESLSSGDNGNNHG